MDRQVKVSPQNISEVMDILSSMLGGVGSSRDLETAVCVLERELKECEEVEPTYHA